MLASVDWGDVAFAALAFFLVLAGIAVAYGAIRLGGTLGRASSLIEGTESELIPVISKLGGTLDRVNTQLDKVDVISAANIDATHIFALSQVYEGLLLKMGEKGNDGGQFFTPRNVVNRLHGAVNESITKPDIKTRLGIMGLDVAPMSPDQFADYIKSEIAKWSREAKEAGIQPE